MFTKFQWFFLVFNIVYVLGFGAYYIQKLNYEFIAYATLVVAVVAILYGTLHITRFPTYIIGGLSVWGLLHMMGGSIMTSDGVLYAWKIYPFFDGGGDFYILKFDQLVHAGLYAIVTVLFLHLLQEVCEIKQYKGFITIVAIMSALGVSAINEIIEFIAVVFSPENGVGGYHNTLLDLVFNLGGAIIGSLIYRMYGR